MKKKILFVCLGNICRSPAAEGIAKSIIEAEGWQEELQIDSAGLHSYHEGELPDRRMREVASKRGYDLTSRSRSVQPSDFWDFDYLIGMDDSNIQALYDRAPTLEESRKIHRMTDFLPAGHPWDHVPDPYYGGAKGFELVLDLLEEAIYPLLEKVRTERPQAKDKE